MCQFVIDDREVIFENMCEGPIIFAPHALKAFTYRYPAQPTHLGHFVRLAECIDPCQNNASKFFMKRWDIIIGAVIFLIAAGTVVGFRLAVRVLKDKVVAALGSGSKVAELNVGWNSVELRGIEIEGPKDWPAARTLYAERVTIVPSLASLLTQQIQISSVTVEQPYLSIVRAPGKLILLPSLLGTGERRDRRNEQPSTRAVTISRIVLQGDVMEVFDATVSRPPLKTRLEEIEAVLRDIVVPSFKERTQIELAAIVKGARRDGRA